MRCTGKPKFHRAGMSLGGVHDLNVSDSRECQPIETAPDHRYLFASGENADFLTNAKADQGGGRGRGRPPHRATQSTSL